MRIKPKRLTLPKASPSSAWTRWDRPLMARKLLSPCSSRSAWRAPLHRSHQRQHYRAAGHCLLFVFANHPRVPFRRRLLYRRQRKPRTEPRPARWSRSDDRLCTGSRGRHFGRHRGLDFGFALVAAIHAASVHRHIADHYGDQPPWHPGNGRRVSVSYLSVRRHSFRRHRYRTSENHTGRRAPHAARRSS